MKVSEEIRIGVYICHCGLNIAGVVNVKEVVEYVKTLPNVVVAKDYVFMCSAPGQAMIKEDIKKHKLNRVVVAACSPSMHEPTFRGVLSDAGLNPYLFEMANIREHCSWVHPDDKEAATEKAKELVRMAVAKARLLEPLEKIKSAVRPAVLVIGGGVAGLRATLDLIERGFDVYLVEKRSVLGGNAVKLGELAYTTLTGKDVVNSLVEKIKDNPKAHIFLNSEVEKVDGSIGDFKVTVVRRLEEGKEEKIELNAGAIIVAIGYDPYEPAIGEYGYKTTDKVVTLFQLMDILSEDGPTKGELLIGGIRPKSLAFILCVGSLSTTPNAKPYCSRMCCSASLKTILKIKEKYPDIDVYVFYKDMRTYGKEEDLYWKAIENEVKFIRFDEAPSVKPRDKFVEVEAFDTTIQERIAIPVDAVVLANGMVPAADIEKIRVMLKIGCGADGFLKEAHLKLRPVEALTDGIFLAGVATGPKNIIESVASGSAAAAKAATIVTKEEIEVEPLIARVNEDVCSGCGVCAALCPYEAITIEVKEDGKRISKVNSMLCKGCGTCAAACPSGAMQQSGFKDNQVMAQVVAAFRGE